MTIGEPYVNRINELKEEGKLPYEAETEEDIMLALEESNVTSLLPNPYLPGLWPLLFFSTNFLGHMLVVLLQVWFVGFLLKVRYSNTTNIREATHVKAVPRPHCGKTELVELQKSETNEIFFIFQRRKYMYNDSSKRFEKVKSIVDCPISEFASSLGITDQADLDRLKSKFGKKIRYSTTKFYGPVQATVGSANYGFPDVLYVIVDVG